MGSYGPICVEISPSIELRAVFKGPLILGAKRARFPLLCTFNVSWIVFCALRGIISHALFKIPDAL